MRVGTGNHVPRTRPLSYLLMRSSRSDAFKCVEHGSPVGIMLDCSQRQRCDVRGIAVTVKVGDEVERERWCVFDRRWYVGEVHAPIVMAANGLDAHQLMRAGMTWS